MPALRPKVERWRIDAVSIRAWQSTGNKYCESKGTMEKGEKMKTYYYNLDDQQARYFANLKVGETMVIVVPLLEQPPEDWKLYTTGYTDVFFNAPIMLEGMKINLPYHLNTRVGLRETWSWVEENEIIKYFYKADSKETKEDKLLRRLFGNHWYSAQSMPVAAIRHWGQVTEARVDRVQNLTPNENFELANATKDTLEDWFNGRYSKPRPRYKKGQVESYECWCWNDGVEPSEPYYTYGHDIDEDCSISPIKVEYKGKPLTIHGDPFVQIATVKKE